MKIMIDPGHGGSDPGACNGAHHEAVYALDIAKRLGAALERQGAGIRYTRTDDTHVSIGARYNAANAWGADAFVSIHLNSAQPSASGVETLVYRETGKAAHLAALVQEQVIDATRAKNRGVKVRTDLGVLRGTDMPAILVETGFISNPDECAKLATHAYRQTVAEAVARGVCAWAGINYKAVQAVKEDEDMLTYEQFKQYMTRYEAEREVAPVSDYAKGPWDSMKAAGITDGTAPRAPLTREQYAVMQQRAGMIGK